MTTVREWIDETKQALTRRGTAILDDGELAKIEAWQHTGWAVLDYDSAAEVADIQLAFAKMLLRHAFAMSELREQMQIVIHKMQGEG